MDNNRLTREELDLYNKSSLKYMKALRQEIRDEESGQAGRIIIAIILISVAVALLAITLIKTGLLMRFGLGAAVCAIIISFCACVYASYKYISEEEEHDDDIVMPKQKPRLVVAFEKGLDGFKDEMSKGR